MHHLAQLNLAKMRAPLDDPVMSEFVAALDGMNALADSSPGFVWRLIESEHGSDEAAIAYSKMGIIANLSAWESVETLQHYVYESAHGGLLKNRRDWFERWMEGRWQVLWWIPEGAIPSLIDGRERLAHLNAHGETEHAFTFKRPFPAPVAAD